MFGKKGLFTAAGVLAGVGLLTGISYGQVINSPNDARAFGLESLKTAVQLDGGVPLPAPAELNKYVKDINTAKKLGKALFWDMQVGSDNVQACASCHFHAGADDRAKNQLNPDLVGIKNRRDGDVKGFFRAPADPDDVFETGGPNYTLKRDDFPFVKFPNSLKIRFNSVEPGNGNSNDSASSMGVFLTTFVSVNFDPFDAVDNGTPEDDPVFNVDGVTVRRVEPRNTPTTHNAVFNFTNFWDGRANHFFNGASPFGQQDLKAFIFIRARDKIVKRRIRLENSSLASQSVGPPLSPFEMSFGGRNWFDIGKKLLHSDVTPLAGQFIHEEDSLLAGLRQSDGTGLTKSYKQLVMEAFQDRFWKDDGVNDSSVLPPGHKLMEANMSLFFGISVMLYESTLVSDQSPFDKWMEGDGSFVQGFGEHELAGLEVFVTKGRCINCHGGPEFTNASVRNAQAGNNVIEPMLMAQDAAIYDNGFYNISVTPTTDDIGRGGKDSLGRPLSFTRQALFKRLGIMNIPFPIIGDPFPVQDEDGQVTACVDANNNGVCDPQEELLIKRVAADGAFKTPGLRNVELTGPYFHNGGLATLKQVVQFYDRGGNFCKFNLRDLDPDIQLLGLSDDEEEDLVKFLVSLTDNRVRIEAEPFDHPQLFIPNGHPGDDTAVSVALNNQAEDDLREIPAVGKNGGAPLDTFLGLDPQDSIFEPVPDPCFDSSGGLIVANP